MAWAGLSWAAGIVLYCSSLNDEVSIMSFCWEETCGKGKGKGGKELD